VLFHATMAERLGLNPSDEKTMSVLQRLGPMSAGEIAEHTGLATASVTNLIDRLVRKGYIQRARDPNDRRRVIVEASPDKVAVAQRLFRSTARSLARLYEGYSVEELDVIANFLLRNAERLRTELARLHALDRSRREPHS
jgi:DNA-binding MarR family transcriptional regulator